MNFQRKDSFKYTTLPFHTFLDIITSPAIQPHMYLRSISSSSPKTSPADLTTDFPELAADFHLPPSLSFVTKTMHSSPLRISAGLAMWLHYDVMANILFQIHGSKTLVLFPPADLKHLSFPAGSTTSSLDMFCGGEHESQVEKDADRSYTPNYPPNTHPQIVTLKPGDALFIPPLWSHAGSPIPHSTTNTTNTTATHSSSPSSWPNTAPNPATASSPTASTPTYTNSNPNNVSIALNIFFASLPPAVYAAGRDVYANRDLAAYEEGRRDVERLVKRFVTKARRDGGDVKGKGKGKGNGQVVDGGGGGSQGEIDQNGFGVEIEAGIPKEIAKAYLERLGAELLERVKML